MLPLACTRQAYYFICILLCCVFLFGCATRNTPAPVVGIYGSTPLKDRAKGTIVSKTYKVKKGETLFSIAWRANSDVRQISELNNISAPYKIFPGQKLLLTKDKSKKSAKISKKKRSDKKIINSNRKGKTKSNKKDFLKKFVVGSGQ